MGLLHAFAAQALRQLQPGRDTSLPRKARGKPGSIIPQAVAGENLRKTGGHSPARASDRFRGNRGLAPGG